MAEQRVEAVERALTILNVFADGKASHSLKDLSDRTGFYKSTILRLIASLERFGYLKRDAAGHYSLGPTLWHLGMRYRGAVQMEDLIRPVLRQLAERTGETASFYVIASGERLCLFRENAPTAVRHHVEEGSLLPLDKGAAGHVLRAFSDLGAADLAAIREAGFAETAGERDPEVAALAVPALDRGGNLAGALALSGPIARFDADKRKGVLGDLRAAASGLAQILVA